MSRRRRRRRGAGRAPERGGLGVHVVWQLREWWRSVRWIRSSPHHGEEIGELTAAPVRAFLAGLAELSPAGRKRKRAAIASFATWAVRHDLLAANPMDRIMTEGLPSAPVKVPKNLPRPAGAADVAKVLAVIWGPGHIRLEIPAKH
ncbi:hypothetical protein SAMN05444920_11838 [Nonomuraea solani]|uniref:Core-binding (CB) domain-containing protein n=1 Tax=Nonomuraea solani TaxID=1144553 RepID=A0A1H6EVH4_9ACTN|nr:hypothetical protein [Nonomuraea solani]SEH00849.1 hypothetical protein SAMN05444920_11838 [Nonomuraea solani]